MKERAMPQGRMIVAMAGVLLTLAACGGSHGPHVASLGSGPASASASSTADPNATALRFAQCMRTKGYPDFPDPGPNGAGFTITPNSGIDPQSPQFQAASSSCRKSTGFGSQLNPQKQNDLFNSLLKFSECIRAHGISTYPDPERGAGGGIIRKPPRGVDTNSPQFQAAKKACDSLLPNDGKGPGGGAG